jgi:23S rRNA (cytidine1920-2'-O)/16S rRNA (cytidine1409-2'-O)-methyltransferase
MGPNGRIIALIKPHYEADKALLKHGVLPPELAPQVLAQTCDRIRDLGLIVQQTMPSPIPGGKGNVEYLALICPVQEAPSKSE